MAWLWTMTALLLSRLVLRPEVASWRAPIGMSTYFPQASAAINSSVFSATRPEVSKSMHSIENTPRYNIGSHLLHRRAYSYRMNYASLVRSSSAKHIHIHIPTHLPASWDKPPAALVDSVEFLSTQLVQLAKEIHRRSEQSRIVSNSRSVDAAPPLQRWFAEYMHRFTLLPAALFVALLPIRLAWVLTHHVLAVASWSLRLGVWIAKQLARGALWSLAWATDTAGMLGQHLVMVSFLYLLSVAII